MSPFLLFLRYMQSNWKQYLLKQAKERGMCPENYRLLSSCENKDEAVELYKKTIDWALEEGYPSLFVLKKDFCDMEHAGIFVGHVFHREMLDEQQVYVFHGCEGTIRVRLNIEKKIIPMLYFANGCKMTVKCDDDIRVPLYIFGENQVYVDRTMGCDFRIFNFDVK